MANSKYSFVVIGRLGKDPELVDRHTYFSLCNTDSHKVRHWYTISSYGKQGKICREYLKKGMLCCVEGERVSQSLVGIEGPVVVKAKKVTFLMESQ